MTESHQTGESPVLLRRRDFLLLGAAAALASSLPGRAQTGEALAARPLSIGFVPGSETWAGLRTMPPEFLAGLWGGEWEGVRLRTVSARSLDLGDQNLAGTTVRLTVHGLYPASDPQPEEDLDGAWLEVLVPDPDPLADRPLVFISWGLSCRPGPSLGARSSFVVPVGLDGRLDLRLLVRRASPQAQPSPGLSARRLGRNLAPAAPMEVFAASFTVDWQDQLPKLQRGVYLLGLSAGTWERAHTLPGPGAPPPLDLRSLVLTVEEVAEEELPPET